jgi:hypothetical protein
MPLRLSLAVGLDRPQFRLRLRRFCRHDCTSWHFAVLCIALLSAVPACYRPSIVCCQSTPARGTRHCQTVQELKQIKPETCSKRTLP